MKWIWAVIQGILMGVIIFTPITADFSVSSEILFGAYVLEGLGILVGLFALYNLRHSFSIAPQPISSGRFEEGGIYAYIRHPMYTAVFLIFFGIAIKSEDLFKIFLFALLVAFFLIKVRYEEKCLRGKYAEYSDYEKKVGRFLPKLIR